MSETQMRLWQEQCSFDGKGTFFCTEEFHFLADAGHELAPHPFLPGNSDWEQQLASWRKAFPQARCWRAHSLVFSQYLGVQLGKLGYDIVSTVDVFGRTDISPFFIPWGVWQMPIYYMDNNDFNRLDFGTLGEYEVFDPKFISQALNSDQVFVFDFHPIHYMLNTPNYAFYVANQKAFKDGENSEKLCYQGYGTRNFFDDLVRAMRLSKEVSLSLPDALTLWRNKHNVQLYDKPHKDDRR